ncbi:hypothetical protein ACOMHN_021656 [Nucella lapillus]
MKQKASTTNEKPNQIFTFTAAAASDEVQARLPVADSVKRVLRRARAAHRPKDPQTLEELIIDGQWSQTAAEQPANFLQYDNGPGPWLTSRVSYGQDRSSGQKSIPELLRGVSHNLRGGQPNI